MNPIKQQITIAEACGWFEIKNHNGLSALGSWKGYHPNHANIIGSPQPIPDYLNDLNAMHDAEKVLTDEQWDLYCGYLGGSLRSCASATASQRAEAFLRTIGKWEET